ncbi:MAG TPA: hypothetical protein VF981_14490 [Gemmatimonadaceae bacterium]
MAAASSIAGFLLIALAAPQSDPQAAARELERVCDRAVSDPRPQTSDALEERLPSETGAAASFLRGCQQLARRDFGRAGAEFERAVKAEPSVAVYHFWFGRASGEQAQRANILRQPGLARRTKGEFEKAVALDPTYIPAREGLVRYYIAAPGAFGGSVDRAREQAVEISRLNAYRGGLAHANVAIAARDTAALVAAHDRLAAQFPDSAVPWLSLVNIHLARRQWLSAWSAIDSVERRRPDLATVPYAIGRAAAESGEQLDRGEAALHAYLRHTPAPNEPGHAATYWRLGGIARQRGDTTAARRAWETALTIDPTFQPVRDALARR